MIVRWVGDHDADTLSSSTCPSTLSADRVLLRNEISDSPYGLVLMGSNRFPAYGLSSLAPLPILPKLYYVVRLNVEGLSVLPCSVVEATMSGSWLAYRPIPGSYPVKLTLLLSIGPAEG